MMKQMLSSSYLFGSNAPYVEELYEAYLSNPSAIDPTWRDYFDKLANLPGAGMYNGPDVAHTPVINGFAQRAKEGCLRIAQRAGNSERQTKVLQIINAYRFLGNRWAQLDPLKRHARPEVPELEPSYYGFTEADLFNFFPYRIIRYGCRRGVLARDS